MNNVADTLEHVCFPHVEKQRLIKYNYSQFIKFVVWLVAYYSTLVTVITCLDRGKKG